jgi:hypothetical protein
VLSVVYSRFLTADATVYTDDQIAALAVEYAASPTTTDADSVRVQRRRRFNPLTGIGSVKPTRQPSSPVPWCLDSQIR